jgi:hypothetical protein
MMIHAIAHKIKCMTRINATLHIAQGNAERLRLIVHLIIDYILVELERYNRSNPFQSTCSLNRVCQCSHYADLIIVKES